MEGYEEGVCERQIAASSSSASPLLRGLVPPSLSGEMQIPVISSGLVAPLPIHSSSPSSRTSLKPAELSPAIEDQVGTRDSDENEDKRHNRLFLYYSPDS